NRADVVALGLRRKMADRHVLDHSPPQRADGLVGHGILLSEPRLLTPLFSNRTPHSVTAFPSVQCTTLRTALYRASGFVRCEGFRMPAYDGRHREHRGWGPAFENLQGRKSREGIRRRCGALYGDLAAARGVADGSRWG